MPRIHFNYTNRALLVSDVEVAGKRVGTVYCVPKDGQDLWRIAGYGGWFPTRNAAANHLVRAVQRQVNVREIETDMLLHPEKYEGEERGL